MELGLNAGFGDPIQQELAFIASLGFTVVRQDLFAHGDSAPIEALVAEFAGQTVRPLFLLAGGKMEHEDGSGRIEPHELAARAIRLVAAANACALVSYEVEVGNEPDIANVDYSSRPQDFAEAVRQSHEALRGAGFNGPVISGGVSNLNQRGLDYLKRALAVGLMPPDVIVGFHRYPEKARGALAPHEGFTSRDDEWNALLAITGARALACTEFGYHTAPEKIIGPITKTRTDQEVAASVMWDIQFYTERAVTLAAVFQLNDGPDPNNMEDRYGIRRTNGELKPVALAIQHAFGPPVV
jgi:hypothetical protein